MILCIPDFIMKDVFYEYTPAIFKKQTLNKKNIQKKEMECTLKPSTINSFNGLNFFEVMLFYKILIRTNCFTV